MIKLRKILFVIFVLIYLILCPTLILYSLGIVINPTKKKVVKTGILRISSVPEGASVILNGKPLNEATPAAVSNLTPGVYTLTLDAPHYRSWTKRVVVSAEKVTPVENILLLPNQLVIKEISASPSETLIPVAGNPYLLIANGPTMADIFIHIWDEGLGQNLLPENEARARSARLRPVIPPDFDDRTAKLVKLHTVRNSPYILFEADSGNEHKLLWIDPLFGSPKVEDISDLFPERPKEIQWDASDARHVVSFQQDVLNRLDLATKAIYPRVVDNVEQFSLTGQDIVFLTKDRDVRLANQTGTNQEMVSEDPFFNDLIAEHFPFKKMTAVASNLIFFLGRNGELISSVKPYLLIEGGLEGFKWNDRPARLLVWSSHSIGFIDFSRRTAEEDEQNSPYPIRWVASKAQNITDAFWVNDGTHILFVDNDTLFLADTGIVGTPDIYEITGIKKNSTIYYSDKIGKIFFLNKESHRLSSLEILPQRIILRGISFETKKKTLPTP